SPLPAIKFNEWPPTSLKICDQSGEVLTGLPSSIHWLLVLLIEVLVVEISFPGIYGDEVLTSKLACAGHTIFTSMLAVLMQLGSSLYAVRITSKLPDVVN